jgi:selenocysteine lyase/cysteine desulfurase
MPIDLTQPTNPQRRLMIAAGAIGTIVASNTARAQGAVPDSKGQAPAALARDEAHWNQVGALFPADRSIVNFENGYFGMMGRPVAQAYQRNIDLVNQRASHYVRTQYDAGGATKIRDRVAQEVGAAPEEVALTRGATEALQNLITNYNRLKPGDVAMYADLDYDSMQYAMQYLKERRGAEVVKISLPEPASHQGVIDAYAKALDQHPKTRLLLLTHLSHRTGLVVPVAEIARMARARGVDVVVDAAHSWGQIDFKVTDLEADFVGFNLHKWMGAPLGVGFMYIRKDRLADISRAFEDGDFPAGDVRSRVHTGTTNIANVMTVPDALDLHRTIGASAKEARLRHLRDLWVQQTGDLPNLQVLTPEDPRLHAGITSIRLKGKTTRDDNLKLAARLRDEFGVFTVRRGGVAAGDCVRISPALFTTADDVVRLVRALRVIAA